MTTHARKMDPHPEANGQELSANGSQRRLRLTAVLPVRATNALCKLFSDYDAQRDTRPTLAELKIILGPQDFAAFQHDFSELLHSMTAKRAVAEIISRNVRRKEAELVR